MQRRSSWHSGKVEKVIRSPSVRLPQPTLHSVHRARPGLPNHIWRWQSAATAQRIREGLLGSSRSKLQLVVTVKNLQSIVARPPLKIFPGVGQPTRLQTSSNFVKRDTFMSTLPPRHADLRRNSHLDGGISQRADQLAMTALLCRNRTINLSRLIEIRCGKIFY